MSTRYKAPSLKEIVESYEQFRKVSGLKPLGRGHHIYQLLYNSRQLWQGLLTQDLLEWWWKKRDTEQPQSHFARVLSVVPMMKYASARWDIPPMPALPKRGHFIQHVPHIFTNDELVSFFSACDTLHKPRRNRESLLTELEVPVMFRLMYANGLRPNECRLLPRKCVDLRTGTIRIEQTKGYIEHQVVVKEDMLRLLFKYDIAVEEILPKRETFFPTSEDTPHRNDWICRQFNCAWYKHNTDRATAYDLRHHYVIANIYSWREQGIGYGLTDKLLALSKSLGHADISSTLYYFSLVPAFEGEMDDSLESALECIAEDTFI